MLQIPYALNILILVPVCAGMFAGRGPLTVFEGKVAPSAGLEWLVGSLWLSILAGSLLGLFWPRQMAPLLAMQVLYKAIWLATFVAPLAGKSGWQAVPAGISLCFAGIVAAWPVFIWLALR